MANKVAQNDPYVLLDWRNCRTNLWFSSLASTKKQSTVIESVTNGKHNETLDSRAILFSDHNKSARMPHSARIWLAFLSYNPASVQKASFDFRPFVLWAQSTQDAGRDACANSNLFPLMLLAYSVDTLIHINRSHLLASHCASRPASCVDWALRISFWFLYLSLSLSRARFCPFCFVRVSFNTQLRFREIESNSLLQNPLLAPIVWRQKE